MPLWDGTQDGLQYILDLIAQSVIDTGGRALKVRWGSTDLTGVDSNFSAGFGSAAGPFNVNLTHHLGFTPTLVLGGLDTGVSTGDTEDVSLWAWRNTPWDATDLYIRYAPRTGIVNFPGINLFWLAIG